MKKDLYQCCICGKLDIGWGNNPYPVKDKGHCCDDCNVYVVVPARLNAMYGKGKHDDNKID